VTATINKLAGSTLRAFPIPELTAVKPIAMIKMTARTTARPLAKVDLKTCMGQT
jgi:hypothetical protein